MFVDKKNELIQKVEKLKNFSLDLDNQNIKNTIESFLNEIKEDLTFNVLCLGDFSSGKSTFINQFFIKDSVLPTSVTTTTAKLTIIKYGDSKKVVLIFKNGNKKELTENFETSLKDFVAKDGKEVENIDYVEVYINSDFLKEGVIIVDSPGLNDPEVERMKVTLDYIKRADSILYLLTAMQAWKKSEKEFLEEKILRKEDIDKIFFLLNYWDMVEENQRKALLEYVNNEIQKSLKIASAEIGKDLSIPPLIPISAKTKENFDFLHKKLWEYLGSKKGEDILKAKYNKLNSLKSNIEEIIKEKIEIQKKEKQEINKNIKQLEKEIEKYKQDVDNFRNHLKDKVYLEVEKWLEEIKEFFTILKEKIILKLSDKIKETENIEELKNEIRNVIQKTIYIEEDIFSHKNQIFIRNIEKIAEEEGAKLNLDKYLLKNKFIDTSKINTNMKEYINPNIKLNYQTDILITGSSVVLSAILAVTTVSSLALFPLGGIIYNIYLKSKQEKDEILKQLPIIEEQIDEIISKNLNQLYLKKEEIVEEIVKSIKNDIVEAYEEKVKLYQNALKNKQDNKDDEIVRSLSNKLDRLNHILAL